MTNPCISTTGLLPVEIVLAPSWWHKHAGLTFDEDFFYHPARRVEDERKMEQVLYDKWGRFGLGRDRDKSLPIVGPVHLAAGYLLSEMFGCKILYREDGPPEVLPAHRDSLQISADQALASPAFGRFQTLLDQLRLKYGALTGDVGWAGILNLALDLRGQNFFMDLFDQPEQVNRFTAEIARAIEQFTDFVQKHTGSTSISVNRNVHNIARPVFLHSECSNTMISTEDYETFFMPFDARWSLSHRPFGIHYCGADPHRYAQSFAKLTHLDFLDLGWGGDVTLLREHLPNTFFNIRLSPVEIIHQTPNQISSIIRKLVKESGDPALTGLCCINMDHQVTDEQVTAIFQTAEDLRREFAWRP